MVVGPLLLVLLVVLAVVAVRRLGSRERGPFTEAHAIRRFFQYLLLYGSVVVMAVGVAGLLGRALARTPDTAGDDVALARDLAFTVVGVPLCAGLSLWSRRRLLSDPLERTSVAWAAYVTAAAVTSLVVAMTALESTLGWAFGVEPDNPRALARFIVWTAIWAAHWWLHLRLVPANRSTVHHLAGSLTGLVNAAAGLATLLGGTLAMVFLSGGDTLPSNRDEALRGAITLVVAAPVWFLYWLRTAARQERGPLWLGYVLIAGVAGGLVTAVVSASTVLYWLLVWFLGEPESTDAVRHFNDAPWAVGAAVAGAAVWWYHQRTLREAHLPARTEVRRLYEYLMAAVGLVAAGVGLTMLVVAAVEALTRSTTGALGPTPVNTLLASATLLAVGGPVWWFYWHSIQGAFHAAPADEAASPTRRAYLLVLFGLGGVAAVVALVVGVYLFFDDVVQGTVGAETLHSMRVPIGILLSTGAIAAYHWAVHQRSRAAAPVAAHGPRYVLLVGPSDPEIARAVGHATGGRVQAWSTDGSGTPWSVDAVLAALAAAPDEEVLVLSDASGVHAIPVHRR